MRVSRLSWLEIASEAIACSRSPPAARSAKRYPAAAATGRWHNQAPGWGMIGSVAVNLAHQSPVAVTIVPSEARGLPPAGPRSPRPRSRSLLWSPGATRRRRSPATCSCPGAQCRPTSCVSWPSSAPRAGWRSSARLCATASPRSGLATDGANENRCRKVLSDDDYSSPRPGEFHCSYERLRSNERSQKHGTQTRVRSMRELARAPGTTRGLPRGSARGRLAPICVTLADQWITDAADRAQEAGTSITCERTLCDGVIDSRR
jgi:hypothetical protein